MQNSMYVRTSLNLTSFSVVTMRKRKFVETIIVGSSVHRPAVTKESAKEMMHAACKYT